MYTRTEARTHGARPQLPHSYQQPVPSGQTDGPTAGASRPAAGAPVRSMEYRGAYSVLAPDEKRRAEITRVAQEETAAYDAYKQSQRVSHVSYVGTVGRLSGAPHLQVPLVQSVAQSPMQKKLDDEERRRKARALEQEQHDRHKATQRQRARANEEAERARQLELDKERRRKNAEFLDRLERR